MELIQLLIVQLFYTIHITIKLYLLSIIFRVKCFFAHNRGGIDEERNEKTLKMVSIEFLVHQRSEICVLCLFMPPEVDFSLERLLTKFARKRFEAYGNI